MKKTYICGLALASTLWLNGCYTIPTSIDELSTSMGQLELSFDRTRNQIPDSISDQTYLDALNGDYFSIRSVCAQLAIDNHKKAKEWCSKVQENSQFNSGVFLTYLQVNGYQSDENFGAHIDTNTPETAQLTYLFASAADRANDIKTAASLYLKTAFDLQSFYEANKKAQYKDRETVRLLRQETNLGRRIDLYTLDPNTGVIASLEMNNIYYGNQAIAHCATMAFKNFEILASQNNPDAQLQLAFYYDNRWGLPGLNKPGKGDKLLAYKWAKKAVVNGLSEAASFMWTHSSHQPEDLKLLESAGYSGDEHAQVLLSQYYFVNSDYANSYHWAEKAVEHNNLDAMTILGYQYAHGLFVSQDILRAVDYLRKPAENGDLFAVKLFDEIYLKNDRFKGKTDELIRVLTEASENGSTDAMWRLGRLYLESDINKALYWLALANKEGDQNAFSLNAMALFMAKDYEKAFELLKNGGTKHDPLSLFLLAECYKNGYGTQKDKNLALGYMQTSAEEFAFAQYALADSYMYGHNYVDSVDYQKARFEIQRYLNSNDTKFVHEARYMLGYLYLKGLGGGKNTIKAKELLADACNGGNQKACQLASSGSHSTLPDSPLARQPSTKVSDLSDNPSEDRPQQSQKEGNKISTFIHDFLNH